MGRRYQVVLWIMLGILVLARAGYFFARVLNGDFLLGMDDYTRYASACRFALWGEIETAECWLPFPISFYGVVLLGLSGRAGLIDIHLMLAVNWLLYFLTLGVFATGLERRRLSEIRPSNLMAAVAFAAIPFVHRLSLSSMTEPLLFFLLAVFVTASARAWTLRAPFWRAAAALAAGAWMASRYEAWIVAGAVSWGMAFLAWRTRRYPRPWIEPLALTAIPFVWMLSFQIREGDFLFFLAGANHYRLGNDPLTLRRMAESFLSNAMLVVLAVWALAGLLPRRRRSRRGVVRTGTWIHRSLPLHSLAVGVGLTGVFATLLIGNRYGVVVPERFAIQALVALAPFVGATLVYWTKRRAHSEKAAVAMLGGIFLGSIVLIELGKPPPYTMFVWQRPVMERLAPARDERAEIVLAVPSELGFEFVPPFLYTASYSITRSRLIVAGGPEDDIERILSDRGGDAPRYYVLFGDSSGPVCPPQGYAVDGMRYAIIVYPSSVDRAAMPG